MFGIDREYVKQLEADYRELEFKANLLVKEHDILDKHLQKIVESYKQYNLNKTDSNRQEVLNSVKQFFEFKVRMQNHYYPGDSIAEDLKQFIVDTNKLEDTK